MKEACIPQLTLEDYLLCEHMDIISPAILQKIIRMHGFNSTKVPKNDLLEAVRSINLMDTQRSTLEIDNISSSNALLSLEDVINDISALHWKECCITSIQTINYSHSHATNHNLSSIKTNPSSSTSGGSALVTVAGVQKPDAALTIVDEVVDEAQKPDEALMTVGEARKPEIQVCKRRNFRRWAKMQQEEKDS